MASIHRTMEDDGRIDLFSIEDPSESIESLTGRGPSESQWYDSGKYFFAISSSSAWEIEVMIEPDAWSEEDSDDSDSGYIEDETDVASAPQEQTNWQLQSVAINGWYQILAVYPDEIIAQVKGRPNLNWVDDLSRGYLIAVDGHTRFDINARVADKIRALVLEIDQAFRRCVPNVKDNFPTGSPTLEVPIDERALTRELKIVDRAFLDLSNVLRKAGTMSEYFFASGVNRLQMFTISAATSIQHRNERRAANQAAFAEFGERMRAANAPQRNAQAFFDEARRRGY